MGVVPCRHLLLVVPHAQFEESVAEYDCSQVLTASVCCSPPGSVTCTRTHKFVLGGVLSRGWVMNRPRPTVGPDVHSIQLHLRVTLRHEVLKQRMGATSAPSHHYWCGAAREVGETLIYT